MKLLVLHCSALFTVYTKNYIIIVHACTGAMVQVVLTRLFKWYYFYLLAVQKSGLKKETVDNNAELHKEIEKLTQVSHTAPLVELLVDIIPYHTMISTKPPISEMNFCFFF